MAALQKSMTDLTSKDKGLQSQLASVTGEKKDLTSAKAKLGIQYFHYNTSLTLIGDKHDFHLSDVDGDL